MIEALKARFGNRIRSVDPGRWTNIYVVGDIHGCSSEFDRLVEKLDLQADELLICVGDVVKKGPDSAGVIQRMRDRPNVLSVLGNIEIKYLKREVNIHGLRRKDRAYIHQWPLVVAWERNLVLHGGIHPRKPIARHTFDDILSLRSTQHGSAYRAPYWFDEYEEDERIFFGHTVTRTPLVRDSVVGLDTGCVYGGTLTAYDCGKQECIAVSSDRVYRERASDAYYTS